jgi:hypothetical protein
MSKRKPCRTEVWFDALTLESRRDLRFTGAFLSAEKHKQLWSCKILIGIVADDGLVREVVKADAAPKHRISLHELAKKVMVEATTLCTTGDVIRYVRVHAVKV